MMRTWLPAIALVALVAGLCYCVRGGGDAQALKAAEARADNAEAVAEGLAGRLREAEAALDRKCGGTLP